jgi:Ser/Thr protein kinase RdoA (MazF antagonist)
VRKNYVREGEKIVTYSEVEKIANEYIFPLARKLYGLDGYEITLVDRGYEICEGQNAVYFCEKKSESTKIFRISLNDRSREDLLAEAEYIRYLSANGGSVSNVVESQNGNLIEKIIYNDVAYYVSLFEKAKGKQFHENSYRYREGVPITEYYYNVGKTIGKLHQLSKRYKPVHRRYSFFDKYNAKYINELIPDSFALLKTKLNELFSALEELGCGCDIYGMTHFDYNDSNYSINFDTGKITVYDFDNSCFAWYAYDLAFNWMFGVGVALNEKDITKRRERMEEYFNTVLEGYKSETEFADWLLDKFPFFINTVMAVHIIEAFEYIRSNGEEPEYDFELSYLVKCIEDDIPYMGFFDAVYSCKNPFEYEDKRIADFIAALS